MRRNFDGVGVTQSPPGRHLEAVQDHFRGRALLCIDVSPSMAGRRLRAAIDGGLDFLDEARVAHYACGLVLWDLGIRIHLPTTTDATAVRGHLQSASIGSGTALGPTLAAAIEELGDKNGDRVVCVFSDGEITDAREAGELARRARELGIRFVVRGLGDRASTRLAGLLTPGRLSADQTVRDEHDLRRGIASMARSLRRGKN